MEILRKRIIFILVTIVTVVKNEETAVKNVTPKPNITANICPFTKIFEDIFKIHNKSSESGIYIENIERAKIFLNTIAKVTEEEKNAKKTSEEQLVNHIINSIKIINSNITKHNPNDSKMNEAIILKTPDSKRNITKESGEKIKSEVKTNQPLQTKFSEISTEDKRYVEILTIEPNNTSTTHNTTHNIIEALKHLMPMFNNNTMKDLHNITIIDKHRNKTHSIAAQKNVSAIIVTYCEKENLTKMNETIHSDKETDIKTNVKPEGDQAFSDDFIDHENDNDEYIFRPAVNLTVEEKKDILEAAEYGMQKMHELYSVLEPKLYSMGMWLDDTNPARYVAAFNAPTEDAGKFSRYGYASLQAAERLKQLISSGNEDGLESREEVQFPSANALRQSGLLQHCPLRGIPKCPPASKRYRTHDGTCNNFNRPRWGSTMTPVQRFLFPSYADDIQAPRISVTGSKLPSAREISASIHESKNVESPGITHLLMQWGQFVDHDITSTSQSRGFNGSVPRCCKNGGRDFVPKDLLHPECMPISVPPTDPFYGRLGVRCLDFVRSSPAPRDDCALGWREQLNQVSAYIDGSPLYASSARQSDKLRLFRNGMLQYGRVQQRRPILPSSPERKDELCRGGAVSTDCFKSGDARVNEHPGLVAAHIVWLRHHNRMAQELAHLNPNWSDEKIYQETRKIVGAMIQHITYKEFLPIVLGTEVMRLFDLELLKKGYYKGYNPKINASPASSFGSAAFRFGHSLVQSSMMRFDRFHRPMHNNVSLHDELTNPTNIWSIGAVDRLLLGMVNQPIQKRDEFITKELTQHLFQTPQFGFGMDLAAINIQRGRDHGVAPYTVWREPCGLSAIESFEDLFRVMPPRAAKKIKAIYKHIDDIDLFTGGMAERPVVGGLVGPTFACIIAQQFSNLRNGDRFWYENGGFDSAFTPAQLQQIRRISLAHVLCKTLDTIDNIQPFVFLAANSPDNERISCNNVFLNNFDLSPWVELDSGSNNDVNKIEDRIESDSNKPIKQKPTTTTERSRTTTKEDFELLAESSNITPPKKPNPDVMTKPSKLTFMNKIKNKDKIKPTTDNTLTMTSETVEIDDKLDFRFGKNKSKRFEDSEIPSSRRNNYKKPTTYNDNDDDDIQSVQSVVINNVPQKRPYNRPVIAVTENIDKYTYLINYVPRTTQSWRQTTKRTYDNKDDGDVVKVTYQTYDDTYRLHKRPNQQNYYNGHHDDRLDNVYYRNKNPDLQRTTYYDTLPSSARSNDETLTSVVPKTNDELPLTTPNLYKLVTFGYVGTYKRDNDEYFKLNVDNLDHVDYKQLSKDFSTHKNDNDIKEKIASFSDGLFTNDYVTKRQSTGKFGLVDNNDSNLTHFLTKNSDNISFNDKTTTTDSTRQTDYAINNITTNETLLTKDLSTSDKTVTKQDVDETIKLSTFYHYDTATKPYNLPRPTRRNDEIDNMTSKKKYYYDNNILHKYTDDTMTMTDKMGNTNQHYDSAKIGYNIEERAAAVDKLAFLDETESKSANTNLKTPKKPPKPAKTPSVSFEIIPSENNPSRWAIFDEKEELPQSKLQEMPSINEDPYALRELPKPFNFSLKKQRPALRG